VPKRLLILNVLLGGVGLFCVAFIVQHLAWAPAPTTGRPRPVAPPTSPTGALPVVPHPPVSAYNIVASRNLFSPTRSEAPATATTGPVLAGPKPNLQGVVLRDTNPVAYLEDPLTKRVAGYRIGDAIAGGRVEAITADHVIISRPDGNLDVRLRDPSKPKPPLPAQPGQPGVPGQPPAPGTPGVVPPATMQPVPQPAPIPPRVPAPQQPSPPFQGPPVNPLIPGRRLSPSLGSRLPLPSASEGIQQPPQPQR
jgi:hypothetical protein